VRFPDLCPIYSGFDVEVCLVLDDFGSIGRAYRERIRTKRTSRV